MSLHDIPFINLLFNDEVTNNFHFIRPWWLLAFFALFLALYLVKKTRMYQSPWQHFLPQHLSKVLLADNNKKESHSTNKSNKQTDNKHIWLKPFIIGNCIIIALAGPAWKKLPQPVYQLERGSVLIMDMSYSVYATDIKPNRLTRARYKANDLLAEINEGEIGLIAYAGDAFIISPLTQDIKNIELLLPSLSPDIMPSLGSNALAALTLAHETLKNSGHLHGDIYWFTDDIDNEDLTDIYNWSNEFGHRLNILGIGTTAGAPIKLKSGELLKDNYGAIVVPKLPESKLASMAKRGGGNYSTMTSDDADIKKITQHLRSDIQNNELSNLSDKEQSTQGDQYQEQGPWLLLIALPFILSYFRRGTGLLSASIIAPLGLVLTLASLSTPVYVHANDATADYSIDSSESAQQTPNTSLWQDLWKTKDQQAQQYFNKEDYSSAAQQFKHNQWQGSAHYKAGDYQKALDSFEKIDTADSLYNQGNALAQMQQYDDAIERYNNALKKNPDLVDAKENLAKVKQAKAEQEKQQEQQKSDKNNNDQQQKENADKENSEKEQGEQNESDQQNNDQKSSDQDSEEKSDKKNKEQSNNKEQQQESPAKKNDEDKENKKNESQAEQATEEEKNKQDEKTAAQIASDKKSQEAEQKYRKTLNKVTDDPYLLLRNKMRLEYQKRRHETNASGVDKKW